VFPVVKFCSHAGRMLGSGLDDMMVLQNQCSIWLENILPTSTSKMQVHSLFSSIYGTVHVEDVHSVAMDL
jgi:hypothetical protein